MWQQGYSVPELDGYASPNTKGQLGFWCVPFPPNILSFMMIYISTRWNYPLRQYLRITKSAFLIIGKLSPLVQSSYMHSNSLADRMLADFSPARLMARNVLVILFRCIPHCTRYDVLIRRRLYPQRQHFDETALGSDSLHKVRLEMTEKPFLRQASETLSTERKSSES